MRSFFSKKSRSTLPSNSSFSSPVNNNNLSSFNSSNTNANSSPAASTSDNATYSIAEEIVKNKIAGDAEDLKALQGLRKDEVIVVKGSADQIESVFDKIHLPYTLLTPEQLATFQLKPEYTVYINCHPNGYTDQALQNVKQFVANGGLLITTDYVLNMMLTKIFPETLHYGGESTTDHSVPIECCDDPYDEILKAFKGEKEWKLAGSSHPITIKDHQNVTVLINSEALAKQYNGNGAVLIRFQYMQGTVYHMISHFHLQHGGASTSIQPTTASEYARQKGASTDLLSKVEKMEAENKISYCEVQNASITTEVAYRAAMGQKKKFMR